MDNKPTGFTCECGKDSTYPSYVYAHWDIVLIYTCSKCGEQYEILKGIAVKKEDNS